MKHQGMCIPTIIFRFNVTWVLCPKKKWSSSFFFFFFIQLHKINMIMHLVFQHRKPTILLVHKNPSHKPKNLTIHLLDMIEIPQSLLTHQSTPHTNNSTIPTNFTPCSSMWGPFFRTVPPAQIQCEVLITKEAAWSRY